MEHPDSDELLSHTEDSFSKYFENIHVMGSVDGLSWKYKLLVDHTFVALLVKKKKVKTSNVFTLDLLWTYFVTFFCLGDAGMCHSALWRFVAEFSAERERMPLFARLLQLVSRQGLWDEVDKMKDADAITARIRLSLSAFESHVSPRLPQDVRTRCAFAIIFEHT